MSFCVQASLLQCHTEKCFVIAIFPQATVPGIFHQAVVTLQTTSCCAFLPDSMQSSIREYITHCLKITEKSRISFLVHSKPLNSNVSKEQKYENWGFSTGGEELHRTAHKCATFIENAHGLLNPCNCNCIQL